MKTNKNKNLIMNLCSTNSVSGEERFIQNKIYDFFSKNGVPRRDALGNVYCRISEGKDLRVMISAHVDEIGLMVNYIDDNGYIYFTNIGFIEPVNLIGQRVWVKNVLGVISKKPSYFMNKNEISKDIRMDELWIDIGACDKKEAENMVSVGDTACFAAEPVFLSNNRVLSKSLDNKAGVVSMLSVFEQMAEKKLNVSYDFVSTIQEEVGFRGAKTIANLLKPDIAIIIDVTNATDIPDSNKTLFGDVKLDGGPVIGIGANINRDISMLLKDTAAKHNLPFQMKSFASTSNTEADIVQLTNMGVKIGVVAIPCRYMHSSYELIDSRPKRNSRLQR